MPNIGFPKVLQSLRCQTLVFLWFYKVFDAKHWFSFGFTRFSMPNIGFPRVLQGFRCQTLVFLRFFKFSTLCIALASFSIPDIWWDRCRHIVLHFFGVLMWAWVAGVNPRVCGFITFAGVARIPSSVSITHRQTKNGRAAYSQTSKLILSMCSLIKYDLNHHSELFSRAPMCEKASNT